MSLTLGARRRRASTAPQRSSPSADRDPWAELQRELDRSRRFERSMTLLRIQPTHGSHRDWGGQLVAATRKRVRSIDRVWHEADGLFLLLPETRADGLAAVVNRVLDQFAPHAVEVEGSTFPDDGITLGALISRMHPVGPRFSATADARSANERATPDIDGPAQWP